MVDPRAGTTRPGTPLAYDLGIDLGTTFTAAAVHLDHAPDVRVVGLDRGRVQVPSVLLVDDDGSLLVGGEAEARAPWAPQRVVREFKRRLGDDTPIVVAGEGFSADGVAAEMVRWTADRVAEQQGREPRRLAVAHPAGWGAYRRRVFTEALAEVGLHDVVLLTEPEAAAAAHAAAGRLPVGRTVAVYDLGGGTFDAAVVRGVPSSPAAPVGLTVLGRGQGIEALGGIDFDEALFWHVCSELGGAVAALDPADPATVRAVAGLRRACVAAKEQLSVDTDAVVDVRLPNVTTRIRVTRGEFEEMIAPALRQTIDVLGEVLDSARVRPADLDGVLLVGGSSRIPLVARMLSAELGRPVSVDPDPTTVVARGATWASAAASGVVRPPTGPFPTPGRAPISGPFERPEPRTEFVGPAAALLAHADADPRTSFVGPAALLAEAADPVTTPVRLRPAFDEPITDTLGGGLPSRTPMPTSALPPARAAAPMAAPGPFVPTDAPDTRRRRIAIGASAAAVLVAGGAVAVTVPMVKNTGSSSATVAPSQAQAAAPAPGAVPAIGDAGTLPAGTLDPATTTGSDDVSPAAATKKSTATKAPVVPAAVKPAPVVPAPAVVPPPAAPAPAAPAPVVNNPTPSTPGTTTKDTPKVDPPPNTPPVSTPPSSQPVTPPVQNQPADPAAQTAAV
ncbi:Hsp70 family protein [Actinomycetospora termitidis]|uniref:Hsp70 family protein n=1 Tax=Actinomycetospora termitidis TaxID=3053470 RepID=A0ABT7MF70_9PSEU|nr:Hsp70 family protein [Actinomycetospora sp. Odt1-22]MDL5159316.1 Hsp70 family protein [Actinomycetospora sp. Odt1-22]